MPETPDRLLSRSYLEAMIFPPAVQFNDVRRLRDTALALYDSLDAALQSAQEETEALKAVLAERDALKEEVESLRYVYDIAKKVRDCLPNMPDQWLIGVLNTAVGSYEFRRKQRPRLGLGERPLS